MATRKHKHRVPAPKNEGARLLRATGESVRQIGAKLSVSPATASRWLTGDRTPEADHARAMQAAYSIPMGTWSQRPQAERGAAVEAAHPPAARPAPSPDPESPPPAETSATAAVDAPAYRLALDHLAAVRRDLATAVDSGLASDVAKFRALERLAIAAVGKLESEIPVTRQRVVESDAFRAEIDRVGAVVRRMSARFPDAFRWLAEELAEHEVRADWGEGGPELDPGALVERLRRDVELANRGSCVTDPTKTVVHALRGRDVGAFVVAHPAEAREVVALLDQAPPLGPEVLEVERQEEREARRYAGQIRAAFRLRELVAAFGSDFGSVASARLHEIVAAVRAGGAS